MADQGTVKNQIQGGLGRQTQTDIRVTPDAAVVTTDAHGRYMEPLYVGNCFSAANTNAAVTFGILATMSTSVTGFCLTNPVASGKNMVLLESMIALAAAPAGAAPLGYAWGASATAVTHTTPLVVRNALLPGNGTQSAVPATGIGLGDSAATVPAQGVFVRFIPNGVVAASSITPSIAPDNIDGKVILSPGSDFYIAAVITTAQTGMASMIWEEVGLAQ